MSAIDAKRVVIVGGGPGGLTLARLLQLQGADVSVFERDLDRSARVHGSALDLHVDSGLAALQAAGLMEGFWARFRPDLDRLQLADHNGTVLHVHRRGKGTGIRRPEIERNPLRELLLDSLEPGTVHWNQKLEGAAMRGEQVQLEFASGERVLADLAIGADGARSRLRPLVTPIQPSYAGVTLVEGTVAEAKTAVPEIWALLEGAALMAMGEGQTLAMATKTDGSLLFYAGLKAPEDRARELLAAAQSPQERVAWFRTFFPGWSALWEPLFACSGPLIWRPQNVCPVEQRWETNPAVTLIGDAAHVMPPYAGEGVNMAMQDALVLAGQLGSQPDTRTAIAAYQDEMFARMAERTEDTLENTEMFYAPDASARVVQMFQGFAAAAAAVGP